MTQRWTWGWLTFGLVGMGSLWTAELRAPPSATMPALEERYTLRLSSRWPAYPGESEQCNNLGREVLEGTVHRISATRYTGRFIRVSHMGFCGAHGSTQPAVCGLTLVGRDTVEVAAQAFDAGRGPEMRVRWQGDSIQGAVVIDGTCSRAFEAALERMYRQTRHQVEISMAPHMLDQGEVPVTDYPWNVAIRRP